MLFMAVCMIFQLTGCSGGSYAISSGNIEASDHSLSGKYDSFSGNYFRNVTWEKDKTVRFDMMIDTRDGNLYAVVIDPDGNVTGIQEGSIYLVPKTGKYRVRVNGDKHNGEFLLTWMVGE